MSAFPIPGVQSGLLVGCGIDVALTVWIAVSPYEERTGVGLGIVLFFDERLVTLIIIAVISTGIVRSAAI